MGSNNSIYQHEGPYLYYRLHAGREVTLLANEHELVINTLSGQVTLVDWQCCHFKSESCFFDQEIALLQTLFNDWPSYTPYEKLLPLLVTEELAEQIRECIEAARERQDQTMLSVAIQPLHAVIQRCQDRLVLFGIQIAPVSQYGYRLIHAKQQESDQP